jgi:hypothetical protein
LFRKKVIGLVTQFAASHVRRPPTKRERIEARLEVLKANATAVRSCLYVRTLPGDHPERLRIERELTVIGNEAKRLAMKIGHAPTLAALYTRHFKLAA